MVLMSSPLHHRDCLTYKYEWLSRLSLSQIPCGHSVWQLGRMMKHSNQRKISDSDTTKLHNEGRQWLIKSVELLMVIPSRSIWEMIRQVALSRSQHVNTTSRRFIWHVLPSVSKHREGLFSNTAMHIMNVRMFFQVSDDVGKTYSQVCAIHVSSISNWQIFVYYWQMICCCLWEISPCYFVISFFVVVLIPHNKTLTLY